MASKIEQLEAEVARLTSALATEVPELKARLVPLESDLAAANAIIEKLPMTADKVRVVPGMELFYIYDPKKGHSSWVSKAQSGTDPRYCYSTRKAAQAAKEAADADADESALADLPDNIHSPGDA